MPSSSSQQKLEIAHISLILSLETIEAPLTASGKDRVKGGIPTLIATPFGALVRCGTRHMLVLGHDGVRRLSYVACSWKSSGDEVSWKVTPTYSAGVVCHLQALARRFEAAEASPNLGQSSAGGGGLMADKRVQILGTAPPPRQSVVVRSLPRLGVFGCRTFMLQSTLPHFMITPALGRSFLTGPCQLKACFRTPRIVSIQLLRASKTLLPRRLTALTDPGYIYGDAKP